MRFSVDRICELAGLGAATGGLLSEVAAPAPATKPAAPVSKAPPAKPAAAPAKMAAAPAKPTTEEDDLEEEDYSYSMDEMDMGADDDYYDMSDEMYIDDNAVYEIDETELMEALVAMRQQRLEESAVRDAVRDEITRALSDKSGSWIYGANRPSASRAGQVSRGGFGIGFKR